ncbi:helix-turn-helix transcriptional regulator [Roseovarius rhodophyticola]|uniref:Helix-turn-helix transcriptional regulator n=1 Tax=Roseovarius rhodophyticola TaxID=3080827 RepID=A0ABZ2TEP0_9RHOB|nr:helix-turn-helix transcriptional regulator [Roseovarius sp. W115]MDV2928363.1 helix-turn-helix transcriptional regulator [Roseovarius sp. W115]
MSKAIIEKPGLLVALIAVQLLCTAFFLWDVVEDFRSGAFFGPAPVYATTEALAATSLGLAVVVELHILRGLMRRKAQLETQVSVASGALSDVISAHFDAWNLTPAERDVALFAIKGFSIAETAKLRGAAEGTVKSQLNAVYRKADVQGRGALLGLLIDDLVAAPLIGAAKG